MKYIYAALLLHTSGKKIDEENIKKIMTSIGEDPEEARIKALIASLSEVKIDEVIKAAPGIAVAPAQEVKAPVQEEKEEKGEKGEKKEEEAIAGLGALFG